MTIQLPVGDAPGWEEQTERANSTSLKSVADSLTVFQSLKQCIHAIINDLILPLLTRMLKSSSGKMVIWIISKILQ